MAHFCRFFKLLFLLLMMATRAPTIDTRPARGTAPHSDLIAGNEFLKLFLERDELHRELHSIESRGRGGSGGDAGTGQRSEQLGADIVDNFAENSEDLTTPTKTANHRHRGRNANVNEDTDSKQVKLVTSGSKIVFLEEYDDNDAVVDAEARDIDIQKEKAITTLKSHHQQKLEQQRQKHYHRKKSHHGDEVSVVAVSVSSSSKRASPSQERPATESATQVNKFAEQLAKHDSTMQIDRVQQQQQQHHKIETRDKYRVTSSTSKPTRAITTIVTTTTPPSTLPSTTVADFINRSHKSEFSIEEAEPLTMLQHKTRSVVSRAAPTGATATTLDDSDSENSASTNIQNVLAAPLTQTAGTAYHSSSSSTRNSTSHSRSHINQTLPSPLSSRSHVVIVDDTHDSDGSFTGTDADGMSDTSAQPIGGEDKLLPFQTVIYHDTKQGHGPQSRSISYSSISQNVEDLRTWQQSGILAEAQRNVSESLKPISRSPSHIHASEPAKFYSVPAKMYGEPAKVYSEPAKIYSEPSKVYGQPEKFYSEPAKVYSQPSKFYSEPAKVYSQPAKVYGEPAKTYWPHTPAVTMTSSTTTTTTITPPMITTLANPATIRPNSSYSSLRRPAIVSRIAFGEAQTSTSSPSPVPTNYGHRSTPTPTAASHFHQRPSHSQRHPQMNSQPRRVLFNLDKLPYDLLNAPEQSSKHLLQPDFLRSPPASVTYASARQRSCLEAALSSSLSTSQQQQRQHSSLSDQHYNQNAKGLPNRDLVKCVSKYSHSSPPTAGDSSPPHFTTERSHIDDLYTPTPEQNYEIEESVSVMTNGRAHGVHGGGGIGLALTTTTAASAPKPTRSRNRFSGAALGGRQYSNSNANANVAADSEDDRNAGVAGVSGTEDQHHHNNYDDDDNNNNEEEEEIAAAEDDANDDGRTKSNGGEDDNDDSKVAYVVEGRNYRKYRVEEKTDDGFIVGEYGVVDHNDGNLRGVRYTADSTINRSLIQKALLTFLKLK